MALALVHDGNSDYTRDTLRCAARSVRPRVEARATLRPTSRGKIIGNHPRVRQVLDTIDRVAASSCTVIITGESGTGKELVVAALHDASARRNARLVTVNCGAIPADLVEAELFGHTRGAFTGAQSARPGFVAEAEGGTLFLDEVGELPLPVQTKLLRLLQQREYSPLGLSRSIKGDVRIVAATNRDLAAEVRAGRFREDVYYRLNVIHVQLPALRERGSDVRLLATHFFDVFCSRVGRTDLRGLSESALRAIEAEPWPGNIRALENAIERGVLLAAGPWLEAEDVVGHRPVQIQHTTTPLDATPVITFADAPRRASNPAFPRVLPDSGVDMSSAVESYQNHLIRQALTRTGGNKNQAARLLGLNRTTLVEIIRRRSL
jgi:DNA-binding NtrC family response regulator